MDRQQDAGANDDLSYQERGADNIEDLTRSDEAAMDRTAQAGTTGAFGAGDAASSQQRREDAEAAFGGSSEESGQQSGS